MILGYPGRTSRYMTSYEVNEQLKIVHPDRIKIRGIKQEIWMKDMQADKKINIQYSAKYFGSSNYWKYSIGQKRGLERLNVVAKKEELENQFDKWVAANPERKAKYGDALDLIKNAIEGRADFYNAQQYVMNAFRDVKSFNEPGSFEAFITALKLGDAQKTMDLVARIKRKPTDIYKDYSPPTDKKSMKAMMKLYRADIPEKFQPDYYANVVDKKFKGDIDKFVDDMFEKSIFASRSKLKAFLNKPSLKTIESDPVYLTAASFQEWEHEISQELSKYDANLTKGRRIWMAALMEMVPEKTQYPDANFTMRLIVWN